jgi:hypothetical protein
VSSLLNMNLTAACLCRLGVVRCVGVDGVRECGFPVYGGSDVCGSSVYGDVKIVQSVISFCFCCKM